MLSILDFHYRLLVFGVPRFSSRVLSDGTLRMLALATLKNDPEHQGVLCFEEPEITLVQLVFEIRARRLSYNIVYPSLPNK